MHEGYMHIVPTVDNLDFHGSFGINAALHVIFLSDTISTPVQMIGHRPFGIQSDLPCMSGQLITVIHM